MSKAIKWILATVISLSAGLVTIWATSEKTLAIGHAITEIKAVQRQPSEHFGVYCRHVVNGTVRPAQIVAAFRASAAGVFKIAEDFSVNFYYACPFPSNPSHTINAILGRLSKQVAFVAFFPDPALGEELSARVTRLAATPDIPDTDRLDAVARELRGSAVLHGLFVRAKAVSGIRIMVTGDIPMSEDDKARMHFTVKEASGEDVTAAGDLPQASEDVKTQIDFYAALQPRSGSEFVHLPKSVIRGGVGSVGYFYISYFRGLLASDATYKAPSDEGPSNSDVALPWLQRMTHIIGDKTLKDGLNLLLEKRTDTAASINVFGAKLPARVALVVSSTIIGAALLVLIPVVSAAAEIVPGNLNDALSGVPRRFVLIGLTLAIGVLPCGAVELAGSTAQIGVPEFFANRHIVAAGFLLLGFLDSWRISSRIVTPQRARL